MSVADVPRLNHLVRFVLSLERQWINGQLLFSDGALRR